MSGGTHSVCHAIEATHHSLAALRVTPPYLLHAHCVLLLKQPVTHKTLQEVEVDDSLLPSGSNSMHSLHAVAGAAGGSTYASTTVSETNSPSQIISSRSFLSDHGRLPSGHVHEYHNRQYGVHRGLQAAEADVDDDDDDSDSFGSDNESPTPLQHQASTTSYTSNRVHGSLQHNGGAARPSVFGRVFILNAGEHPVLRLSLQVCVCVCMCVTVCVHACVCAVL